MLLLLLLLVPFAAAYPLGLGRYGRSLGGWPPLGLYYPPRTTRPYYYLPQDPYYYPVVPTYYQRPYYYGYDEVTDPADGQEDTAEGEDGTAMGGYGSGGQDLYYAAEPYQETNDDVNARFLQNLILAQMYSDANKMYSGVGGPYEESRVREDADGSAEGERWVYGEPVRSSRPTASTKEDEDVRELKSLVRAGDKKERRQRQQGEKGSQERRERKNRKNADVSPFDAQLKPKPNDWDEFRSSSYKRSEGEMKGAGVVAAVRGGQKEEVLPPSGSALAARPGRAPRQPSVYDTIKKLLHMEEQLEEKKTPVSRVQKRSYIPSEDSLVAELGGLKKAA